MPDFGNDDQHELLFPTLYPEMEVKCLEKIIIVFKIFFFTGEKAWKLFLLQSSSTPD